MYDKMKGTLADEDFFKSQSQRRALAESPEYRSSGLALGATLLVTLVLLLASIDLKTFSLKTSSLPVAAVYAAQLLITLLLRLKIKRDIVKRGEIAGGTRCLSPLLIIMCLAGNVFSCAMGFLLLKKRKNLEYSIGIYMMSRYTAFSRSSGLPDRPLRWQDQGERI